MSEAPAAQQVARPKVSFVERRDSDSSIASAASDSTIDSEGPETPDEEIVMHLGMHSGKGNVKTMPALEVVSEESLGMPVQSGALVV